MFEARGADEYWRGSHSNNKRALFAKRHQAKRPLVDYLPSLAKLAHLRLDEVLRSMYIKDILKAMKYSFCLVWYKHVSILMESFTFIELWDCICKLTDRPRVWSTIQQKTNLALRRWRLKFKKVNFYSFVAAPARKYYHHSPVCV